MALRLQAALEPDVSMGSLVYAVMRSHMLPCDPDEGGCGTQNTMALNLRRPPGVLTIELAWATERAPADDIKVPTPAVLAAKERNRSLDISGLCFDVAAVYALMLFLGRCCSENGLWPRGAAGGIFRLAKTIPVCLLIIPMPFVHQATLGAVDDIVDLGEIYSGLGLGMHIYKLRSMVCYYGAHYQAFVLSPDLGKWLIFDDESITVIGSWESVKAKCLAGRIQPSVLFYEQQQQQQQRPK